MNRSARQEASARITMSQSVADAPLTGVRVLDLSRILAGPVCCQVLGDLGGDVVKVERPGQGDDTRTWGPPFVGEGGPSAYYLSCNRNKRSLALDLERPEARPVLEGLIRRADVLVENFLPKDLQKFGLTPERLAELNPQLVSCSISGYGRTGPLANVAGYDLIIQAISGLMSITGEPDGMPMKVGVAITDVIAGLYAAIGALAGLHARGKWGHGTSFDLALADCTLASLVNVVQSALVTGERPKRYGNAHPQIVPYQVFATADGHLVLGVGNDRQWRRFCELAGIPALADDARYATNPDRVAHRDELIATLTTLVQQRTTSAWEQLLAGSGVPHSAVLAVDEALASAQVAARGMVAEVTDARGRTYPLLGTPLHWPGHDRQTIQPPPGLGEHTAEILREWLDWNANDITALRQSGVLG
jgi:crotonobetainyl-CoA:carnitine CoA-transferase CaiB-like acyl-CoA transferase